MSVNDITTEYLKIYGQRDDFEDARVSWIIEGLTSSFSSSDLKEPKELKPDEIATKLRQGRNAILATGRAASNEEVDNIARNLLFTLCPHPDDNVWRGAVYQLYMDEDPDLDTLIGSLIA